jgi:uncharacterized protein YjbJ (UPF0337 family)
MAARTRRGTGRLKEAWGALTDNKKIKDKGRRDRMRGTAKKHAGRVAGKVKRRVD